MDATNAPFPNNLNFNSPTKGNNTAVVEIKKQIKVVELNKLRNKTNISNQKYNDDSEKMKTQNSVVEVDLSSIMRPKGFPVNKKNDGKIMQTSMHIFDHPDSVNSPLDHNQ